MLEGVSHSLIFKNSWSLGLIVGSFEHELNILGTELRAIDSKGRKVER